MDSTRSLHRHGNLFPSVFSLLAEISASTPHAQHHLRAPGAIYNLSVSRVLTAFRTVLDTLESVARALSERAPVGIPGANLLSAQTELLEAMSAHIEDAYQIMKACHPQRPTVDEKFAETWLKKAGFRPAERYGTAMKPYRDVVAELVNRVKHEHGQLRLISFSNGFLHVPGYYLEAIDSDGVAIPDPVLHPKVTAFSFNRDVRLHFLQVYEIGNQLKAALSPALKQWGIPLTGRPASHSSADLLAVARRIESLGMVAFPDEIRKPTPHVRVQGEDDDVTVVLRYPSLATFRAPDPSMVVTTLIKGDGFTNQFQMPYFGRDIGVSVEDST